MSDRNRITRFRTACTIGLVGFIVLSGFWIILIFTLLNLNFSWWMCLLPVLLLAASIYNAGRCVSQLRKASRYEAPVMEPIPVPDKPEDKPDSRPKPESDQKQVHPVLNQKLEILKGYISHISAQIDSVADYLDDYFGSSQISKSRYNKIMQDSLAVAQQNYRKALQAARLFGTASNPSEARLAIMDNYIADTKDVSDKIETVINQLILVDQQDILASSDVLDASLEELARTTRFYAKGERNEV